MSSSNIKKFAALVLSLAIICVMPCTAFAFEEDVFSQTAYSVQTPDTPDTSNTNDTPDTPDTSNTPDTSDTSDTPDTSETSDSPLDEPKRHDTPDSPDIPISPPESDTDSESDTDNEFDTDSESDTDSEEDILYGDVSGDGAVTAEDALLVLRYSVGYISFNGSRIIYADINKDGSIDSTDAFIILRLTVETETDSDEPEQISADKGSEKTDDIRDDSGFSRGIDVSMYQHNINFNRVKASGIDFVIIRAGYGRHISQKDPYFEQNYARAKAAGLKVGVYWYSYAESAADARQEARTCMLAIQGKQFDYPIYFDLEERWQLNLGMNFCSSIVTAFCSELEANGYYAGFYTSRAFATSVLTYDVRTRYAFWIAEWGSRVNYTGQYGMWQYGGGYVDGVNGVCDLDYSYIDYPSVMREFHLNGY